MAVLLLASCAEGTSAQGTVPGAGARAGSGGTSDAGNGGTAPLETATQPPAPAEAHSNGPGPDTPAAKDLGAPAVPGGQGVLRGRVTVPGGPTFEVEIVQDEASRAQGLMHRRSLPERQGMLFSFPAPGNHRFWMYNCLISLDIIWLDAAGTVLDVEANLPVCPELPCPGYGHAADATYVLELGAGVAARSNIRSGTRLEIMFAEPPHPR